MLPIIIPLRCVTHIAHALAQNPLCWKQAAGRVSTNGEVITASCFTTLVGRYVTLQNFHPTDFPSILNIAEFAVYGAPLLGGYVPGPALVKPPFTPDGSEAFATHMRLSGGVHVWHRRLLGRASCSVVCHSLPPLPARLSLQQVVPCGLELA